MSCKTVALLLLLALAAAASSNQTGAPPGTDAPIVTDAPDVTEAQLPSEGADVDDSSAGDLDSKTEAVEAPSLGTDAPPSAADETPAAEVQPGGAQGEPVETETGVVTAGLPVKDQLKPDSSSVLAASAALFFATASSFVL